MSIHGHPRQINRNQWQSLGIIFPKKIETHWKFEPLDVSAATSTSPNPLFGKSSFLREEVVFLNKTYIYTGFIRYWFFWFDTHFQLKKTNQRRKTNIHSRNYMSETASSNILCNFWKNSAQYFPPSIGRPIKPTNKAPLGAAIGCTRLCTQVQAYRFLVMTDVVWKWAAQRCGERVHCKNMYKK